MKRGAVAIALCAVCLALATYSMVQSYQARDEAWKVTSGKVRCA